MVKFPEVLILNVDFIACLYLAYTDLRWKKAQNRYTFGLLLFGLAWQLVFVFHYGTMTLWELAWIVVEALGIAFLIYYIGGWSPGDAKVYWALAVTIPASLLRLSAPFVLIANTFVAYFFLVGGYVLLKV
jgi:Flp pilus assembly protein protease CpaA